MMKTFIESYRKTQDAQWNWIRNHPVKYVALNATIIAAFAGYLYYENWREQKDIKDFERRIQYWENQ